MNGFAKPARLTGSALASAGALVAIIALATGGPGASAGDRASAPGQPPPEWAENAGAWPVWVPKIPFRLQISHFGLSDQSFGTPHAYGSRGSDEIDSPAESGAA